MSLTKVVPFAKTAPQWNRFPENGWKWCHFSKSGAVFPARKKGQNGSTISKVVPFWKQSLLWEGTILAPTWHHFMKTAPHWEKKWSQNGSIPDAVSWYVTQLHPWHYFGATFKGGAVFLNMIIKGKTASSSKVAPFSKKAPGWSHFGSTFFLSALCQRGTILAPVTMRCHFPPVFL